MTTIELLAELTSLQAQFAEDVLLATTRDQHIRATQRQLQLARMVSRLSDNPDSPGS